MSIGYPRLLKYYRICSSSQLISRGKMDNSITIQSVKKCIPDLNESNHKGQAGRIGIIGGSVEYTGAPYFAGISALKVGADLVHIFCASSAATVIKCYSPELIVHPLLDQPNAIETICPWFDRLHAIVIGPGLGRETSTFGVFSKLIDVIKAKKIPLVIDADGLFLISENLDIIKDYPAPLILTPNKIEFERLKSKVDIKQLGCNVCILKKGAFDEFISTSNEFKWESNVDGSARRCGGQGDILSGSLATFFNWTLRKDDKIKFDDMNGNVEAASIASYAASRLVRLCNKRAFKTRGRSMLATDMIEHIHDSFEELFGN